MALVVQGVLETRWAQWPRGPCSRETSATTKLPFKIAIKGSSQLGPCAKQQAFYRGD
jgi:hypothetical protein